MDGEELSIGCGEGLFEKLDWSAIGGKEHYMPQAVSDCGLGGVIATTVLAWDKDKLPVGAVLVGLLGRGQISWQAGPA